MLSPASEVTLLLVMKRTGNIRAMEQILGAHGVRVAGVSSEEELDALLEKSRAPDLALVDVTGFGASVWRMCASLQSRELPFMVLFQPGDANLGNQSLQYGALSLLQKPIAKNALLQFIASWRRSHPLSGGNPDEHA